MDKLYVVLTTIFTHILFLIVKIGIIGSLYVACRDSDPSCLIITALCVLAEQCVKGIWYFTKIEWKEMRQNVVKAKRRN